MSCKKVSTFDSCRLIQESFVSPIFDFGTLDVSNDTFIYSVRTKNLCGDAMELPTLFVDDFKVGISPYNLPISEYSHELLWIHGGKRDLVFQGTLKVTNNGQSCCGGESGTIEVVTEETTINVSYSESVIIVNNGSLEWGGITGNIENQTDLVNFIDGKIEEIEVDLTGYATEQWVEDKGYALNSDIPTKTSELTNDSGFVTSSDLPNVGNGTITITQGGVSKGTFTTNQSGNTTIEVDASSGNLIVNITHADLLALVNTNSLVAGKQYRITDYVATVDESSYNDARSNNHSFDIIVTADSTNKLNESARAIRHEGDTYFSSTVKFESWQIKYTIYNDSSRFDWAVSSGKGVVYQLIDEWGNDVSYDFKSIQFKRNDIWCYTFGGGSDASLSGMIFNNEFVYSLSQQNPSTKTLSNNLVNGQFSYSNYFGLMCNSNTFGLMCNSTTFGDNCINNTFGDNCINNTFGDNCINNTFGDNCINNTFGDFCSNLIIESNPSCNFKVGNNVSDINLSQQISNFTTPPNWNVVNVIKTPNGVTFSQVINATTTESFDVV